MIQMFETTLCLKQRLDVETMSRCTMIKFPYSNYPIPFVSPSTQNEYKDDLSTLHSH